MWNCPLQTLEKRLQPYVWYMFKPARGHAEALPDSLADPPYYILPYCRSGVLRLTSRQQQEVTEAYRHAPSSCERS